MCLFAVIFLHSVALYINIVIMTPVKRLVGSAFAFAGDFFVLEERMNILDRLFAGDLVPELWCKKTSDMYREAQQKIVEIMEGLDMKTADALMDQFAVLERETTREYFTLGFCWAIQLWTAALQEHPKNTL